MLSRYSHCQPRALPCGFLPRSKVTTSFPNEKPAALRNAEGLILPRNTNPSHPTLINPLIDNQHPKPRPHPKVDAIEIHTGAELYAKIAEMGMHKAHAPTARIAVLGVLAGVYVSMGAILALTVAGNLPASNPGLQKFMYGAFGYPMGLSMVAVLGGDLFTGNTAFVGVAWHERLVSTRDLFRSWCTSYTFNIIGAALFVGLVGAAGMIPSLSGWPAEVAIHKVHHTFFETFVRAILCNWLVCSAMALAASSTSMAGKFVGIFLCNSAFASLGLEHCIANFFILLSAIAGGAPITWSEMWLGNIIPATMGNIVGGFVCYATMYALAYGRLGRAVLPGVAAADAVAAAH